jgi:cyclophilin family peptidyl-prolyl cis-trans isomerase
MRRMSAINEAAARATRVVSFVVLTLALVGCSPSAPEATVDEAAVPDPVREAPAMVPLFGGEPATPDGAPEVATEGDGAAPVLVVETVKGTIEIETYPDEAPRTVEHIVELAQSRFYNGLRVHRVEEGFVVQFGDPQTRDMSRRATWGSGGSGSPIGVSEVSPLRKHQLGAVAVAHPGDPTRADSQVYIAFGPQPELDPDYTVFGQVVSGIDVAQDLAVTDVIRRVTVK